MNVHRLRVLDRAVAPVLLQLGGVVEEARRDALTNRIERASVRHQIDLDALQQPQELVPDVPRALHGPHLHEVLVAPLRAVIGVGPLVVHVEQGEVVPDVPDVKRLMRVVRQLDLILGPVEDGVAAAQHAADRGHLLGAPILITRHQRLAQHRVQRELGHPAAKFRELAAVVQRAEGVELLQRP